MNARRNRRAGGQIQSVTIRPTWRTRHRYRARRQFRVHGGREAGTRDPADPNFQAAMEKYKAQCAQEREQVLQAGGFTSWHERTNRAVSTTSCEDVRTSGRSGSSRFFISLEDDLLRIFARPPERPDGTMGMEDGVRSSIDGYRARSKTRRRKSNRTTSTSANISSNTTMS